ncbi:MAG: hypothetical protein WC022_01150 [Parcubacteria group bacterium]
MPDNKKSIIKLFEENELNISLLYDLYAKHIHTNKDFWKKLSLEEIAHAKAIAEAFKEIRSEEEYFQENNFSRGIIKYISDFVAEKIIEAENNTPTHIGAIEIALRVEQSMLEKKCFEIFIPTDASLKSVLQRLNKDTERHAASLREELKKCQKK